MTMLVRHSAALIELLSMVTDDTLLELGLNEQEVDAIADVFDMACDHYENLVGLKHPLERPTVEVDESKPYLVVVPAEDARH